MDKTRNPTLPVVKALVDSGHEVHFLCLEMAREKAEAVGAVLLRSIMELLSFLFSHERGERFCFGLFRSRFHNTMDVQSELYAGRGLENSEKPKLAIFSIMEERALEMSFLNILKPFAASATSLSFLAIIHVHVACVWKCRAKF